MTMLMVFRNVRFPASPSGSVGALVMAGPWS